MCIRDRDESADDKADQKELLVELNGIEDRIVRPVSYTHLTWVVPYFQKTGKIFTMSLRSKMDMTFAK